ncbi:integrase [Alphaproteobacteria bacterium 46_93_T64]|nr:integrase [Alphaproteobacteria bacterium 46_93_T64]
MARQINRLSAVQVKTEKKRGLHADGGGLYLQISSFETKSWIFRFSRNKRSRDMGLGPYPDISLLRAREEAQRCREALREGLDPIEERKSKKQIQLAETAKTVTFRECAEKYINIHSVVWSNIKHVKQWSSTLETYVYPFIGDLSVKAVDIGLILKILEPIWLTKPETASRIRGRVESILDWAAARKYREGENPARWKGNLDKLLPSRSMVRKVKHHAALPFDDIAEFMAALRKQGSISAMGLELLILTACRTGEIIKARWGEIDFDKQLWTIPEERMKAGREHRVPLSPDTVQVLKRLSEVSTGGFVLPGQRPNSSLSNMAFLQLLKRMDRADVTAHGFRSSFKDWSAECTQYPNEVSEMALAHSVSSKVEAAYRRGDLFEKRRGLMDDWASFCNQPSSEGINPMAIGVVE